MGKAVTGGLGSIGDGGSPESWSWILQWNQLRKVWEGGK